MAAQEPASPDKSDGTDGKDRTDPKHRLRPGGGYRRLHSFQTATMIYDATVSFCERFIDPRSRTRDQMVQAARSGRQNIAEGNRAGATSGASEIHLTNVARASLDELLLDYDDFLRQRGLVRWTKDSPEAIQVRQLGRRRFDRTDPTDRSDRENAPACPRCGQPMRLRTARQGKNTGTRFWGCPGYPDCRGTRPLETGKRLRHRTDQTDRTDQEDP